MLLENVCGSMPGYRGEYGNYTTRTKERMLCLSIEPDGQNSGGITMQTFTVQAFTMCSDKTGSQF